MIGDVLHRGPKKVRNLGLVEPHLALTIASTSRLQDGSALFAISADESSFFSVLTFQTKVYLFATDSPYVGYVLHKKFLHQTTRVHVVEICVNDDLKRTRELTMLQGVDDRLPNNKCQLNRHGVTQLPHSLGP